MSVDKRRVTGARSVSAIAYGLAADMAGVIPPVRRLRNQRDSLGAEVAQYRRSLDALELELQAVKRANVVLPSGDLPTARPGPLAGTVRLQVRADLERLAATGAERIAYEDAVTAAAAGHDRWTLPAFCQACGAASVLHGDWLHCDGARPNFRERLICPSCGLNNRQRFMTTLIQWADSTAPAGLPFYLYEQVTALYAWASAHLPGREVIGSEYLGHDHVGGSIIDGLRHEDALALSFADESLAAIISTDVFEHVPDIDAALREAARVIATGGSLLFSIPFHADRDLTVVRAELRAGEVVELMPAQYHGNPVSDKGSLVFYDHGWDILDRCRAAGFADAYAVGYWSPLHGYLGNGLQTTFIAERRD